MFKEMKKDVDRALKVFLKETETGVKLRSSASLLYSGIQDFITRDGKRVRPILFMLGYLGYTRQTKVDREKLVRASLSVELLHDFLLIHDDVIDKSDLRRGKPTLHRYFNAGLGLAAGNGLGPDLSIVAGDVIFAMAVEAFLDAPGKPACRERALREFTRSAAATGAGEFVDVVNNMTAIDKISRKEIFLTYILKTARYTFEGPLVSGAMLAGATASETEKLSQLGIALGQAFQIQDDLLDVFSSSKKTGKPMLSDLDESKKTLMVWKTYQSLSASDRREFKRILEKDRKTARDLGRLRDLIILSGAQRYCLKKIEALLAEAISLLAGLKIKKKYKVVLDGFVKKTFIKTEELGRDMCGVRQ